MIAPTNTTDTIQDVILSLGRDDDQGGINKAGVKKAEAPSITDLFDKSVIMYFRNEFRNSKVGGDHLAAAEFKNLLQRYLPEEQCQHIYEKVDVNDDGYVSFMEFIDFLISSEAGTILAHALHATKLKKCLEQVDDPRSVHRDMIDHICYSHNPMPVIITGGRDGNVRLWDPSELALIRSIKHEDKNTVYLGQLMQGMSSTQRAQCLKSSKPKDVGEQMAITAMCVLQKSGHLCVGSADASVTLYDLGTQDPIGRITCLKEVPSALITFNHQSMIYDKMTVEELDHHPSWKRKLDHIIAIGGSEGGLYIFRISPDFGTYSDAGAKKKNEVLVKEGLEAPTYVGKVHSDWISRMIHIPEADVIATASMDGMIHMFDMNHNAVSKVYAGHSKSSGVKAVSYSKVQKYVVSAADRHIEVWDAFTIELVYTMPELEAPIVDVQISDAEEMIIAASTDKIIHLWNAITFELLQTVYDHAVYRPRDVLSSVFYCFERQQLYSAGNRMTLWSVQRGARMDRNSSDDGDICSVLVNSVFMLVLVVTTLGAVDVFQAQSGSLLRRFYVAGVNNNAHNQKNAKQQSRDPYSGLLLPVVKFGCFDKRQRRLLIVTCDDRVELWNFNNAQLLSEFRPMISQTTVTQSPPVASDGSSVLSQLSSQWEWAQGTNKIRKNDSISCILYETTLNIKKNRTVKRYIIVGTEQGHVYGCEELATDIDNTPTLCFRCPATKPKTRKLSMAVRPKREHHDPFDNHSDDEDSLDGLDGAASFSSSSLAAPQLVQNFPGTTDHSILCVVPSTDELSKCLVSLNDGRFFVWDMLQSNLSVEIDLAATGSVLHCMGDGRSKSRQAGSKGAGTESFTNDSGPADMLSSTRETPRLNNDAKTRTDARREAKAELGNDSKEANNNSDPVNKTLLLLRHRTNAEQQHPEHTQHGRTLFGQRTAVTASHPTPSMLRDNRFLPKRPGAESMASGSNCIRRSSQLSNTILDEVNEFSARKYSILSGRVRTLQGTDTAALLASFGATNTLLTSPIKLAENGADVRKLQLAQMMLDDVAKVAAQSVTASTTSEHPLESSDTQPEGPVVEHEDQLTSKQKMINRMTCRIRQQSMIASRSVAGHSVDKHETTNDVLASDTVPSSAMVSSQVETKAWSVKRTTRVQQLSTVVEGKTHVSSDPHVSETAVGTCIPEEGKTAVSKTTVASDKNAIDVICIFLAEPTPGDNPTFR
jgi:WD40 repeat protein